jgi:hypothetical protein
MHIPQPEEGVSMPPEIHSVAIDVTAAYCRLVSQLENERRQVLVSIHYALEVYKSL